MHKSLVSSLAILVSVSSLAIAAEVPTFEQLDGELDKYKGHAKLEGPTNAHLDMDGIPFHCLFDLVLTVLNCPEHPKHAETKAAWAANQAKFLEQSGIVGIMMGKNLLPLLITSSEAYANGFKKGAAAYAPGFNPEDYVHPGAATREEGDGAHEVAWFHAYGDADGDGVTNKEELEQVAPNWRAVKDESGAVKEGTGLGATEEIRDKFVEEALGCESWRVKGRTESGAESEVPAATE